MLVKGTTVQLDRAIKSGQLRYGMVTVVRGLCFRLGCDASTGVSHACAERASYTFSSYMIGPQFVAAVTVLVVFAVELQHFRSFIKILLDSFQIVHQPIATCEQKKQERLTSGAAPLPCGGGG